MEVDAAQVEGQDMEVDEPINLGSLVTSDQAPRWKKGMVAHLNRRELLALFQSCPGGRDAVLAAAQRASMHLAGDDLAPLKMSTLHASKDAFMTRGEQPTTLRLTNDAAWIVAMAQDLLGISLAHLQGLELQAQPDAFQFHGPDVQAAVSPPDLLDAATLASWGELCPHLRHLNVESLLTGLPSPDALPQLQELHMHLYRCNPTDLIPDIARYMGQLHKLTIRRSIYAEPELTPLQLHTLLNPGNLGSQLLHLNLPITLTSSIVGLLLACAPILQELGVWGIAVGHVEAPGSQATWRKVVCEECMALSSLLHMPLAAGAHLSLGRGLVCDTDAAAAVAAVISERIGSVSVWQHKRSGYTALLTGAGVCLQQQPAALRAGISLLRAATPAFRKNTSIVLHGWSIEPAIMQELQRLPAWGRAELACLKWMPGPGCSSVLGMLPTSFHTITVFPPVGRLSYQQYLDICLGARGGGEHARTIHIVLAGATQAVVGRIQAALSTWAVFRNVRVTNM